MAVATGWWAEAFITLTGIPTGEAFGGMDLEQAITLAGIPTGEAFGDMVVIGPPQDITLAGIPSAEAFGSTTVEDVEVMLTGIPTGEAFGTLQVNQNVTLTGIASAEAFGALKVNQNVTLAGIPGAEAFGTMTLRRKPVLVGLAISSTTSVTIPTHQAGDLILVHTMNGSASAMPATPAAGGTVPTWTVINSDSNGACDSKLAWAVATSSGTTTGTWTNAGRTLAVVLRNQAASSPVGGQAVNTSSGTNATAPAVTLTNTDGSSMLLHFYAKLGANTWNSAPAGYTKQQDETATCLITKDNTTTDGSVVQGSNQNQPYVAHSVEIIGG